MTTNQIFTGAVAGSITAGVTPVATGNVLSGGTVVVFTNVAIVIKRAVVVEGRFLARAT